MLLLFVCFVFPEKKKRYPPVEDIQNSEGGQVKMPWNSDGVLKIWWKFRQGRQVLSAEFHRGPLKFEPFFRIPMGSNYFGPEFRWGQVGDSEFRRGGGKTIMSSTQLGGLRIKTGKALIHVDYPEYKIMNNENLPHAISIQG